MAQYWNQYPEPPPPGPNPLLQPNISYPISYPHEEIPHFSSDLTAPPCPIDLTQFASLLNCLFRCESSGLEGTGFILPPTQTLTTEKQAQVFFSCNLASSPQDNEMREFFRILKDVLSFEAREQERLHATVNEFCTTYVSELKKSSEDAKLLPYQNPSMPLVPLPSDDPFSHGTVASSSPKVLKGRKRNLPSNATSILKKWLFEHSDNPYPAEDEKLQLVNQTGLSLKQINNWFINARRRILRPPNKSEEGGGHDTHMNKRFDDDDYKES